MSAAATPSLRARPWSASGAFAVMCLCWGSTYVAIKEGVSSIPPFFFAGLRFLLAGGLLLAWIGLKRRRFDVPSADRRRLLFPALLMISVNYGLLTWGVQRLDSGLAAVMNLAGVSFAVFTFSVLYRQEAFAWAKLVGIGIGIAGLVLLFSPGSAASRTELLGVVAIVLGAAGYGWGTALNRPVLRDYPALEISALQMTVGGIALCGYALLFEPIDAATLRRLFEPAIAMSLLYLVIAGSIVGFTLYQGLLKVWPSTRVATYTFVCPIIALFLGAVIFDERIGALAATASALMLLGAYVVMRAGTQKRRV